MPPRPSVRSTRYGPTRRPSAGSPSAARASGATSSSASRSTGPGPAWASRREATSQRRSGSGRPPASVQAASRKAARASGGCASAASKRASIWCQRSEVMAPGSSEGRSRKGGRGGSQPGGEVAQLAVEPGPRERPAALDGGRGDAEGGGGLLDAEPAEEPALDDGVLPLAQGAEPGERLVEGQQLLRLPVGHERLLVEGDPLRAAAALPGAPPLGVGDEHAAHGLRRQREELRAVLPADPVEPDELEVGLVDERRRVEGVVVALA